MKKAPNLWTLKGLENHQDVVGIETEQGGKWVPARPLGLDTLPNRIKLAWAVFTGKYDALKWPGGQ